MKGRREVTQESRPVSQTPQPASREGLSARKGLEVEECEEEEGRGFRGSLLRGALTGSRGRGAREDLEAPLVHPHRQLPLLL